jgi:hypothetical protein
VTPSGIALVVVFPMAVVSCHLDSFGESYCSSASLDLIRGVDEVLASRESRSVNFQNKIRYILSSVKITKSHKKTKLSFLALFIIVYRGQNLDLSFLLSLEYIIFRSKKLHTDKI